MKKIFTFKRLFSITTVFFIAIVVFHFILRQLRYQVYFDMDQFWPVSIFSFKLPVWQDILTLLSLIPLYYLLTLALKKSLSVYVLIIIAALTIIATNLLQGIDEGFITPIAGANYDHQYWQDVDKMTSTSSLLKHYTILQPTLHIHSRVHPPGPMLIIFWLRSIWNNAWFVTLTIFTLSLSSAYFLYDLIKKFATKSIAKYSAVLYLLLPSVQIYSIGSIDALIAALFIGTYWAFNKAKSHSTMFISALLLFSSVMMTFGVIFLIPILLVSDWLQSKNFKKSLIIFGITIVLFGLIYLITDYNYVNSFFVAKSFEGTKGFYAFTHPLSYLVTRLEDILEILIFFTPTLCYLLYIQLKKVFKTKKISSNLIIPYTAVASLLLFLLTGAYYTGETARAAMYIYPFFMLAIGVFINKTKPSFKQQSLLLSFVFAQTVLMQLFGWYGW